MKLTPLYANEKTSAMLLDMKPKEFLSLVDSGILLRPVRIGPFERWDMQELRAIERGEALDGFENVIW